MAEWKPIETAPKDGTEILAYGIFTGEINGKYGAPQAAVVHRVGDQWHTTVGDYYSCICDATHWMPIPELPNG